MKIIGHRGAAGLALENTLAALLAAKQYNVDAIEFDVRMTKDQQLVLYHDAFLGRLSSDTGRINEYTLAEIRKMRLFDGSTIPTLKEALQTVGSTPVIIEIKEEGSADVLLKTLDKFPHLQVTIASFHHQEITRLKHLRPTIKVYLAERTKALEIVQLAKTVGADGLDLNFWLLNPLNYRLAKRARLELMLYTVNNKILARWLTKMYPGIAICTNHPEYFLPRSKKSSKTKKKLS